MDFLVISIVVLVLVLSSAIKILPEWERGVVLRFGRNVGIRGPGLIVIVPGIERLIRVDTRTVTMDVQPQDVITKDNVSIKVNAVVYFKVVNPEDAIIKVEDFYFATSQIAQTTLRSVLGQYQLDEVLASREKINQSLQVILDRNSEPWGIKVSLVEVKNIDIPKEMQRAMAIEAEAERDRRAKVISAEGEVQRAQMLSDASKLLAESPSALQLAYLQTLTEISSDKTTTIVFPIPMDILNIFDKFSKSLSKADS
jgi:regulator of protease activity HflC (stomatin/prohibitin superfamily)